ncbi:MAG: glucose 1-dehydrogenase [Rhodospirillaceae bacterium]|nr:glucose 1-dehydrogenase [Rhodospirillaceae bacterium]
MFSSSGRVAGRIAIVTGAASGLGKRTAEMLAIEGAKVVTTDINLQGVQKVAADIGDQAIALGHDVTSEADWQAVIKETIRTFGGLHVLVNNAGIGIPGTVEETTLETWHQIHAVDLDSVFLGCKHACRPIAKSVRGSGMTGSIVNISSVAGIIAASNLAAYNSAKAAVGHLSKSVALHCAREGYNIRCNSVHPAFVDTPILDQISGALTIEEIKAKMARQLPLGHIGDPTDVGYAVLYLASDESRFMTGAALVLDGGVSAM